MDRRIDPYVEVSIHTPDWSQPSASSSFLSPPTSGASSASSSTSHPHRSVTTMRTSSVKNNGFNPVWQEMLKLPFECVGHMRDLVFVRFTIQRDGESDGEPIAVYCISLGSLAMGTFSLPHAIGLMNLDGTDVHVVRVSAFTTSRFPSVAISVFDAVRQMLAPRRLAWGAEFI